MPYVAAVRILPDEFAPSAKRAGLLNGMRRHEDAPRDLDNALRVEPEHLDARRQRMQTLEALGRVAEAEAECAALLGSPLVETEHRLWPQGAELAAALGRTEVAIRLLEAILQSDPSNAAARSDLDRLRRA